MVQGAETDLHEGPAAPVQRDFDNISGISSFFQGNFPIVYIIGKSNGSKRIYKVELLSKLDPFFYYGIIISCFKAWMGLMICIHIRLFLSLEETQIL